ncbi:MAG TPA: hypothetical protein VJB63_02085 [Patescibacteria group bacterium]|nr:hypothetical protein [Patescibacteria group bacterium]
MDTLLKNRKMMIFFGIIVIIGLIVLFVSFNKPKPKQEEPQDDVLPKSEIIPTIDASVEVVLISKSNKEVILTIEKIPSGTTSIEYELSYLAKGDLPKGVIGTIVVENDESIERSITLGTCSSGKCVYDQGVEKIKVSLKFIGNYGSRLFEKEFEL